MIGLLMVPLLLAQESVEAPAEEAPAEGEQRGTFDRGYDMVRKMFQRE